LGIAITIQKPGKGFLGELSLSEKACFFGDERRATGMTGNNDGYFGRERSPPSTGLKAGYGCRAGVSDLWRSQSHALYWHLNAVANPENTASIRVTQRLRMTSNGLTTQYYDAELALFERYRHDYLALPLS
jgi:hypothetical protein